MKIEDCRVGMKVMGGMFNNVYEITKVKNSVVWVKHTTGEKIMRYGKWIPEEFHYKNVRPHLFKVV